MDPSPTTGDLLAIFEGANEFGKPSSRCCDATGLQIHFSEDAATELRHSLSISHNYLRPLVDMVLSNGVMLPCS